MRNEIARVRYVGQERLKKADVACGDVLAIIGVDGATATRRPGR